MCEFRLLKRLGMRALMLLLVLGLMQPVMAATITVTTFDDVVANDSLCSLREALFNAAVNNSTIIPDCAAGEVTEDVVLFDASLFGPPPLRLGTLFLNNTIIIGGNSPLVIRAPVGTNLSIRGDNSFGLFEINMPQTPGVPRVEFDNMLLRQGHADRGGAIFIQSGRFLTVNNVTFADNHATEHGGAIASEMSGFRITANNSTFLTNSSGMNGGAINLSESTFYCEQSTFQLNTAGANGGAIFSETGMNINQCMFIQNEAMDSGGGILVYAGVGVYRSQFISNRALNGRGGGLLKAAYEEPLIANYNLFRQNFANDAGGGLYVSEEAVLRNNQIIDNTSNQSTGGAFVFLRNDLPGDAEVIGNTFSGNQGRLNGTGSTAANDLRFRAGGVGGTYEFYGNVFNSIDPPVGSSSCRLFPQDSLTGGFNVAKDTSCIIDLNTDVVSSDLQLVSTTINNHEALLPLPTSPAVDLWPAADCELQFDYRESNRPEVGNAINGNANCDAGSIELSQGSVLSVSIAGAGDGQVVSQPAGLDCEPDCVLPMVPELPVSLSATASAGSIFVGWSGDCTGNAACQLDGNMDAMVTATFDQAVSNTLDLTLSGQGSGTVTSDPTGIQCPGQCIASFAENTVVTLTTTAGNNSIFDGFSGDCTGATCTISMETDRQVDASFSPTAFPLTVNISGPGVVMGNGIDCPGVCELDLAANTAVSLTTMPNAEATFIGWSGACSGTGTCDLIMDQAQTVDAEFLIFRNLSVTTSGSGNGQVTSLPSGIDCPGMCDAAFEDQQTVTLTATPSPGNTFLGWTGDCTGLNLCSVFLDSDSTVNAEFRLDLFTLSVAVQGMGSVTSSPAGIDCPGSCSAQFAPASSITLTPNPEPGQVFVSWSGACSGTGDCVVSLDSNQNVTALFELDPDVIFKNSFE